MYLFNKTLIYRFIHSLYKIFLYWKFNDEKYKFWILIIILFAILLIVGIVNIEQIIQIILKYQ